MPEDEPPLSESEVKTLAAWIEAGAPWPETRHLAVFAAVDRADRVYAGLPETNRPRPCRP